MEYQTGFEVLRPFTCFPVASIFKASIQQVTFLTIWKKANVIQIPKISLPQDITKDLRPISLTSTLSKICERFVTDWLLEYIKEKIDRQQFASLKNTSTTYALLCFAHHLLYETDIPKTTVGFSCSIFRKLSILLITTSCCTSYTK